MEPITNALEKMFKEKNMPIEKRELENNQHLYSGAYRLAEDHTIPFNIVVRDFKEGSDVTEYQISYRKISQVQDYNKTPQALEVINDLNRTASGYYNLVLAGDGEIYLRLLSRTTTDVKILYELLVFGSATARVVYPKLEKAINGREVEVLNYNKNK
ncbi:hypothetical protein [Aerococcus kribbianus]|uniref:Uncharacterized protein n=1 Tax=Aerococcus kribbianus TaxID=2999064 RepID=A0A9X3FRP9_9LACT|nr:MULTISPECIES: hypothetical protein [unclassified Aerococcus]MCZ0717137.1 hypothetical protein [Aerococcus sp. YH-aer221]MCZ0725425.1 hypothetical protein [Aerococcus sp. YH-aer222]